MKLAVTRKTITWSGVVTVLVAVLAINGGAWLLERALMAPVNAYIRDRTLAFLQEKSVEGLRDHLPRLDLSLLRRQVLIHDLSIRYDNKDSTRYVRFQATRSPHHARGSGPGRRDLAPASATRRGAAFEAGREPFQGNGRYWQARRPLPRRRRSG